MGEFSQISDGISEVIRNNYPSRLSETKVRVREVSLVDTLVFYGVSLISSTLTFNV